MKSPFTWCKRNMLEKTMKAMHCQICRIYFKKNCLKNLYMNSCMHSVVSVMFVEISSRHKEILKTCTTFGISSWYHFLIFWKPGVQDYHSGCHKSAYTALCSKVVHQLFHEKREQMFFCKHFMQSGYPIGTWKLPLVFMQKRKEKKK